MLDQWFSVCAVRDSTQSPAMHTATAKNCQPQTAVLPRLRSPVQDQSSLSFLSALKLLLSQKNYQVTPGTDNRTRHLEQRLSKDVFFLVKAWSEGLLTPFTLHFLVSIIYFICLFLILTFCYQYFIGNIFVTLYWGDNLKNSLFWSLTIK